MTERFYLPFSPSSGVTRSKLFHINKPLRFAHSSVSCAPSFLVSFKSGGYIARIARVVAPIIAEKQIYIVRLFPHLSFLTNFSLGHWLSAPPFICCDRIVCINTLSDFILSTDAR